MRYELARFFRQMVVRNLHGFREKWATPSEIAAAEHRDNIGSHYWHRTADTIFERLDELDTLFEFETELYALFHRGRESCIKQDLHERLLDVAIAISPLSIPVYEAVWILEWVLGPLARVRFNSLAQLRLLEGTRRSVDQIRKEKR